MLENTGRWKQLPITLLLEIATENTPLIFSGLSSMDPLPVFIYIYV